MPCAYKYNLKSNELKLLKYIFLVIIILNTQLSKVFMKNPFPSKNYLLCSDGICNVQQLLKSAHRISTISNTKPGV